MDGYGNIIKGAADYYYMALHAGRVWSRILTCKDFSSRETPSTTLCCCELKKDAVWNRQQCR